MNTITETKKVTYQSNTEPKVGDKVMTARDIQESNEYLYVVTSVGGGRLANKVGIRLTHISGMAVFDDMADHRELYYYCLCPQ